MKSKINNVLLVTKYLRPATKQWEEDTRKKYNNKCVLSGVKLNTVVHHHIETYLDIVNQAHDELGIEFKYETKNYTQEELDKLFWKIVSIHQQIGPGVCLYFKIHNRLHAETGGGYGIRYTEFVERYKRQSNASKRNSNK